MRPALRYFGGKWRLSEKILSYFPSHTVYLEPCFGAGSILLNKRRSKIETVNDQFNQITNFFQVLRDEPEKLVWACKTTPYSRAELEKLPSEAKTPLEKARRFWFHSWAAIANTEKNISFRVCKTPTAQPANIILDAEYLFSHAKRLLGVQIENKDAIQFLHDYIINDCLVYFDPPYPPETRKKKKEYVHESTMQLHEQSAELFRSSSAMVIISGYNCNLYQKLYGDWKRIDIDTQANSAVARTESLWFSPAAEEKVFTRNLFSICS